jgi:hypothetical protein
MRVDGLIARIRAGWWVMRGANKCVVWRARIRGGLEVDGRTDTYVGYSYFDWRRR